MVNSIRGAMSGGFPLTYLSGGVFAILVLSVGETR